jgi:uncharacterized GH25 family protein
MIGTLLLAVTASALVAHDLFMKLDTYFLAPSSQVTIPIYNGTFMKSENSITADRVLDVSIVKQGERVNIGTDSWLAGENNYKTYLTIETGEPGTYVIGTSTKHRDFGLSGADFNEYLRLDGIPDVLEARRHIKAIVQVGEERSTGWEARLGYPAEIVPTVNPYELSVGDEIAVLCLVDGQPVANQLVIAGGHGQHGAIEQVSGRTDNSGSVRFRIGEPGRWYVKFINMVKLDSEPDIDYESKWATMSFEIR